MNEAREIREIINDISNIINESFVFNGGQGQPKPQSQQQPNIPVSNSQIKEEEPEPELGLGGEVKDNNPISNEFDIEIGKIRKIALSLLSNLDPSADPESYKMIKGIWDSCDKYLVKDNISKPKNNNNNNI